MKLRKATVYLILMILLLAGGALYIYFVMGEVFQNIIKGL
jgi:hypothetical protein